MKFEEWIEDEYAGESDDGKAAARKLFRPVWQAALRRAAEIVRNYPLPHAPNNELANNIAELLTREAGGE